MAVVAPHILDEVIEEQVEVKSLEVPGLSPNWLMSNSAVLNTPVGSVKKSSFRGSVSLKVWLVQGPGRLSDEEIGREPRVAEPLHNLLGRAAHRHRFIHLPAGLVEQARLGIAQASRREHPAPSWGRS